jgi:hypothetical protein
MLMNRVEPNWSTGGQVIPDNQNFIMIANCLKLSYSENHFPLFNAISQLIISLNISEQSEVLRFLCNNQIILIHLNETLTWGSYYTDELFNIIGFVIERNEENFYLWFITQQYLLISDPIKVLQNFNGLYDRAKEKLISFNNQDLTEVIFYMEKISMATSIIAQKVDGLRYVRRLSEFKEELTQRFRIGFYNISFSSEFLRNENLLIQSMDELKVFINETKNHLREVFDNHCKDPRWRQAQMTLKSFLIRWRVPPSNSSTLDHSSQFFAN